MTTLIVDQCTEIGLTIRASKCAALCAERRGIPFFMGNTEQLIIAKDTDKYLGVEVDCNGIHWRVYYTRVIASYNRSLHFFTLLTHSWTTGARATAYAVLVHPQLEYAAALFALASLDPASPGPVVIRYHDIWKSLEAAYEQANCRILGQKRFDRRHYSILGWTTLQERFLQLVVGISLKPHKLSLPPLALGTKYIRERKKLYDTDYESLKE
jgi:hypothetical protein